MNLRWLFCPLFFVLLIPLLRAEPYTYTPRVLTVRTTAYTHSESDHKKYGRKTAAGTDLECSREYHSAAADWSVFPVGTEFRIKGLNRHFVVEDYGSALVGKDTIDIYFPTRAKMNRWGVQYVDILITRYGDFKRSQEILSQRLGHSHCRKMHDAIVANSRNTRKTNARKLSIPPWDHRHIDEALMAAAAIPASEWNLPLLAIAPDPRFNDPDIVVFEEAAGDWVMSRDEGKSVSKYWEVASYSPRKELEEPGEDSEAPGEDSEAPGAAESWWTREVPATRAVFSPQTDAERYQMAVRIALPPIPDPEPPSMESVIRNVRPASPQARYEPRPRHFVPIVALP